MATLLIPVLAACGGGTTDSATSPTAAAESTPASETDSTTTSTNPGSAGQSTVTFAGSDQSFDMVNCVSGTDTSLQGYGKNDTYSLTFDVQDGSGPVTLSNVSDMTVAMDGTTTDIKVSSDGSFTVSGTSVFEGAEGTFTATGTCGTLNWA